MTTSTRISLLGELNRCRVNKSTAQREWQEPSVARRIFIVLRSISDGHHSH
jgi:hypothetical protein